jgi:glycogen operon protein
MNGDAIASVGRRGERVRDDTFLLLFNAHEGKLPFTLPDSSWGERWARVLDTAEPLMGLTAREQPAASELNLESRSLVVFRQVA